MAGSGRLTALMALLGVAASAPAMAAIHVDFSFDPVTVTQVSPGSYTFSQAGFSGGASVTGSFVGSDLNGDGQLSYFTAPPNPTLPLEVTDFTLSFSGNALVPAFSFTFPELDNLNYQFGPTLGTSPALINGLNEGIESGSTDRFYISGEGPLVAEGLAAPPGVCDGTQICGGVLAVPEPGAWTMLLLGLAGVGAPLRLARVRLAAAAPRHRLAALRK